MKRTFAIVIVIALCMSLCACPALEQEVPSGTPQVHITVGKVEPGMTAKDVLVEVTIDSQPVACRVQLTGFVWDGYWEMAEDDVTDGKCTTCNYVIGDRVTNPETTPAETTPEPGHNAEQSNNTWIKILLVALVCFAAAITATVIILKKKKGE